MVVIDLEPQDIMVTIEAIGVITRSLETTQSPETIHTYVWSEATWRAMRDCTRNHRLGCARILCEVGYAGTHKWRLRMASADDPFRIRAVKRHNR